MALSTCQPLSDAVHSRRFPGQTLLGGHWGERFGSLRQRGLVEIDDGRGTVTPTRAGATLVEAIMQTEII
jgi:oxygen-independent coproporphyrinogen-3 oxidase